MAVVVVPCRRGAGRELLVLGVLHLLAQHAVRDAAPQLLVGHGHGHERGSQGLFAAELVDHRGAARRHLVRVGGDAQAPGLAADELTAHDLLLGARLRVAAAAQAELGAHGVDGALTNGSAVDEQDDRVGGRRG